jgi:Replication-relaxation
VLGSFRAFHGTHVRRFDLLALSTRERAALRLLVRAKVATTSHLTTLVYHRRQTTQLKLMRLWHAGLVERTALPPVDRGGAPLVFRISRLGRRRLGYPPLTRAEAGMQLRHDLHVLDAICALLRPHPLAPGGYPISAWCTPGMSTRFIDDVKPDALLALQLTTGSAVLCLEVDEGTEHAPIIRDKLERYAEAIQDRPDWHLVFVVGWPERADWMARLLGGMADEREMLRDQAWAVTIEELATAGLAAGLRALRRRGGDVRLAHLCTDLRDRSSWAPVGSDAWLRILGSGAGEDLSSMLPEPSRPGV